MSPTHFSLKRWVFIFIVGATAGFLVVWHIVFAAFQAPTADAPGANVPAPVNVGATTQVKSGGLGVGSLTVDGGTQLNQAGGSGRPSCIDSLRGSLWFTRQAATDTLEMCALKGGTLGWYPISF